MTHTAESLIAFEKRIAAAFEAGKIKAPVHLCSDGQAQPLIDIFRDVQPEDYIFTTWRNHFHCLLKGMPEEELFAQILAGRSMFVMSKEHRIVSSAIVGGILPLALGVAIGNKRCCSPDRVWVFLGDMASRSGLFHEFGQYVRGHDLPVRIVIEDNGYSTNAVTEEIWGTGGPLIRAKKYSYARNWPHVGTGTRVRF